MTLRTISGVCCLAVFWACAGNNRQAGSQQQQEALSPCYTYMANNDTVILQLALTGDSVTGTLTHTFYEKDRSTGTVKGIYRDDMLLLDYTYQSEGLTSVREVTYAKTAEGFIEGYGEMKEENGKMIFKRRNALVYNGNMLLKPGGCI